MPQLCHHGGALRTIDPAWSYFPRNGVLTKFGALAANATFRELDAKSFLSSLAHSTRI
jgi:hypothetical protein